MEYNGGRTADTIVSWVMKKSGPPSKAVVCDELKSMTSEEANKFVMAYFGAETDALFTDVHLKIAAANDKVQFVHVADESCATGFGAKAPGLVFFRQFEDKEHVYTGAAVQADVEKWFGGL